MKASWNHSIRASVSNVQPHSARREASECAIPEVDNNAGHGWPMLAQNPLGTRSMLLVTKSCHETGLFRSASQGKTVFACFCKLKSICFSKLLAVAGIAHSHETSHVNYPAPSSFTLCRGSIYSGDILAIPSDSEPQVIA